MSEIYCPDCGSRNALANKYCSNCGASLDSASLGDASLDDATTIICPSCESENAGNLLYCDNCGTRLVADTLPEDSSDEGEEEGGTRSKPFSLPSRPPGQTGNLDVSSDLPEWLKTGEFSEEEEAPEEELEWLQAAREEEDWQDEGAPTLDQLSGDHAPQDDLPDWLVEDEAPGEFLRGEKDTDELFMASFSGDEEPTPSETGSLLEGELPDWLKGLAPSGEEHNPTGDETDDVETGQVEAEPAAEDTAESAGKAPEKRPGDDDEVDAEGELHVWLSELEQDEKGDHESEVEERDAAEVSGVPEWLNELEEEEPAEPESEAEEFRERSEAPDWLADLDDDLADELVDVPLPAGDERDDDEAPDWLSLEAGEVDDADRTVGDEIAQPSDEWLDDLEGTVGADEESGPAAEEIEGQEIPEEDFLQWLDSLDNEQAEEVPGTGDEDPADLAEASFAFSPEDESSAAPAEGAPAVPGDEGAADSAEGGVPVWLGELSSEDEADATVVFEAGQGMPEWLHELPSATPEERAETPAESQPELSEEPQPEQSEQPEERVEREEPSEAGAEEKAVEEPPTEDDDLPQWLSGVTTELVPDADEPTDLARESAEERGQDSEAADEPMEWPGGEFFQAEIVDEQQDQVVQAEDLPDWFSDVMDDIGGESPGDAPREATELENVPPQLAGRDLPEWLDSPFVDDSVAEPTPLEEIPEWLRSPLQANLSQAAEAEEEELELDEVERSDEWNELLEELPPPQEGAHDLATASIPEWLEALKPPELGGAQAQPAELPEEPGGPLAGLRDVISIAPAVSAPKRSLRAEQQTLSAAPQEQVALLRQISRADYRSVAVGEAPKREPVAAGPWIRLLLALLLLGAVIAGLLYPDLLAETGSFEAALAPGINDVFAAAAGRPVLVAFEFTPAMAGALAPEANALLRELNAQGSDVLFVSQSPAGVAMARQAREGIDGLLSRDLGYIPGGPIGLRRVAGCLQGVSECQTVYGPELDAGTRAVLADTALIVILAGDQDALLSWIEQVGSTADVPIFAAVTPAVAPLATPYRDSGQLAGLLSTVASESAGTGLETTRGEGMITAQALSRWMVAAAIFVGALFYALEPLLRRFKA